VLTIAKKKCDDEERLWERKRSLRTLRRSPASRHGGARLELKTTAKP
jgi:hypothetical protein